MVLPSEGRPSEVGGASRCRSPLIVPMRSGNSPQGTRRREAADRATGLVEGQITRTLGREVIVRSTGIGPRPLGDATPFHAGRQATEVDPHPSLSNNL
jgi:hypothetical protein